MITIHIMPKNRSFYTIFVKGNITNKITIPEEGTLIEAEGIVIIYYKYSYHRRAYIICNSEQSKFLNKIYLPNIKQKLGIIYHAQGRKIDLLRQVSFNLEKIASGKRVYELPIIFWQKVSCLLDNFNGYKSAAIKSNLIQLYDTYKGQI